MPMIRIRCIPALGPDGDHLDLFEFYEDFDEESEPSDEEKDVEVDTKVLTELMFLREKAIVYQGELEAMFEAS